MNAPDKQKDKPVSDSGSDSKLPPNSKEPQVQDMQVQDICVLACAEAFRGDGSMLCNPIGNIPLLGGRLARATFEPDLICSDAVSLAVLGDYPIGQPLDPIVESYLPYRTMFDIVWSGKRHVMMGASQIDIYGNQNIAAIGDWKKPKAQLLGLRGAPGNLINHKTSYFVPNHSLNSFVEKVDIVSGPGYDKMKDLPESASKYFEIGTVVSNLGVFNFSKEGKMQVKSLHPNVSFADVQAATAFPLLLPDGITEEGIPTTPIPTEADMELLNNTLDPNGLRYM